MDRNSPDYYVETATSSISSLSTFLEHFNTASEANGIARQQDSNDGSDDNDHTSMTFDASALVKPILTPRMAISTNPPLLSHISALSEKYDLPIQTHLSENPNEITKTLELFPDQKTYTGVYDSFGILKKGTILAHCVHLSDDEMDVIQQKGAGISHCPSSNLNLGSGVARVREMLDKGMKVGLGGLSFLFLAYDYDIQWGLR